MTEIELKILDRVKEILPRLKEEIKGTKTEFRYIEIPFYVGNVLDFLIYDKEIGKFIKVIYLKGIGKGNLTGENEGLFDDYRKCVIDITNIFDNI